MAKVEPRLHPCSKCRCLKPIDELDGKPTVDRRLKHVRKLRGQVEMLRYAGDHGYDFDRLECSICYGDGYSAL